MVVTISLCVSKIFNVLMCDIQKYVGRTCTGDQPCDRLLWPQYKKLYTVIPRLTSDPANEFFG
jgi:hypothetical protein